MAVKKKQDLEVLLCYDTKEKDTSYVKDVLDKKINKDGIKISESLRTTCKPLGCRISTADITIMYKIKDSKDEWIPTNFAIERKCGMDLFSSLYTASNRDRLFLELDRCKEANLQFIFVSTDSIEDIMKGISNIPKFKNTNAEVTFFENFMKLQEKLNELGFLYVTTGKNGFAFTIRRLIKRFIVKNKLQYKC